VTYPNDIEARLRSDFSGHRLEVARAALAAVPNVNVRVIRCVLHLAAGRIDQLEHYVQCAQRDARDVILWAEYDHPAPSADPRRLRDFNLPFPASPGGKADSKPPR
jgi:hypothetical protein